MTQEATPGNRAGVAGTSLSMFAEHWGLVLGYGLFSLGLGVTLAVWPDETLAVVAVLIGIQLLVGGGLRIVTAALAGSMDGGRRVLLGLSGALAVVIGLLCLRDPLQTFVALGLILGAWWVVSGALDVVGALLPSGGKRRAGEVASGVVSIVAGGFLLVETELSLAVLVFVLCAWMILVGLFSIGTALYLRADGRRSPQPAIGTPAGPGAVGPTGMAT
jgi:uncharacterized membrane protein HdeD (DUF308 family)